MIASKAIGHFEQVPYQPPITAAEYAMQPHALANGHRARPPVAELRRQGAVSAAAHEPELKHGYAACN